MTTRGVAAPAAALLALLAAACANGAADGPTSPGLAAAPAMPGPAGEESGPWRDRLHWVPLTDATGAERLIQLRLCRPAGEAPAPLVVINHGSPARAEQRPAERPRPCTSEAVGWFLARGYAVALPLRRGYGATGGAWAEGYGPCAAPDFAAAGLETARDIAAVVAYARRLPYLRPSGVVVIGQSAGGWGTLAYASANPPGVAGFVNIAGGRGGWAQGAPNTNCRPDRLAADAARLGATAHASTLWIYTANDSFFDPALAAAMHRAYTAAGGVAELHQLGPQGRDGHGLFFSPGRSAVWGPLLERHLAALASGRPAGTLRPGDP